MANGPKVSVDVQGLSELLANLRQLPRDVEDKVLQYAANKGIQPILTVARGNAARIAEGMKTHEGTGLLLRSVQAFPGKKERNNRAAFVGIKRLTKERRSAFRAATGARGSDNRDDPFYWRFWEFGTSKLPRRQFITNAYETMKFAALTTATQALREGIDRMARALKGRSLKDFKRGLYG